MRTALGDRATCAFIGAPVVQTTSRPIEGPNPCDFLFCAWPSRREHVHPDRKLCRAGTRRRIRSRYSDQSPRIGSTAAEQYSNTVSVSDPVDNKLLGVIRLGDPQPANLSPLYRGQVLRSRSRLLARSQDARCRIDRYQLVDLHRHGDQCGQAYDLRWSCAARAFYAPDGKEVWVTVRGEDYVSVVDANSFEEKTRIKVANGPGMQIFSPDGKYGYVCSSFTPEVAVITVADHKIVGHVKQASPFCPNIAASADGKQVWFTLKDTGKTQVFNAQPPFDLVKTD